MEVSGETVRYGRRKGKSRGSTPPVDPNDQTAGLMHVPTAEDLRQVTILSQGDWSRIAAQLEKKSQEEERMRARHEEKKLLHQRSKEMVKNWSNTIAGQRLKKLEARAIREEKEEAERVQVDIGEAKFQAQRRKEAIEKAKTLQYYQTDRVKGFHGALLLTEVLKEREAQINLKDRKDAAMAEKDKGLLARYQRELEEGILEDHKKAVKSLKERKQVAEFQIKQIEKHIADGEREVIDDIREGEDLKQNVIHYNAEKAKIEGIRTQEKIDLMNAHKQTVANRDLIRAAELQKEEEEEEEIRIFAAAKKKMTKLRKEREQTLWQKKQDNVNKMVNKLDGQLKAKMDDEDDRIAKAVEEREAARDKEAMEKEQKLGKNLQEEAEHRMMQMKQREQLEREEKRRELEALYTKMEADKLFAAKQKEKYSQTRTGNVKLAKFHIKQVSERQDLEVKEEQEKLEMDKKNLELLAMEEIQFQEYAKKVIDHCEEGQRNTYPLRKAAREGHGGGLGPVFEGKGGIRPSYLVNDHTDVELPHYQRNSTDNVKYSHAGNTGKTSKRLGFVW
ncbi:coiled-coil domain-containing protein 173-like isoform X1 [Asterias rubens]|uniref:coiled-coil domain-containing protein 173-like isoform X1 n=2 Tax=Asterias rubens TaxID=7604 RepID=UPI0014553054|nr:coiled-coil domain-containing protein 173-like isoform X1 [Asterias rubens]XP_033639468.1 coiled-coil domain-containing protein 173-like isoform X1 [Asterias rubens]